MLESVFKPESSESSIQQPPNLFQQAMDQSFDRKNVQSPGADQQQSSLKQLGFPDLSLFDGNSAKPSDHFIKTGTPIGEPLSGPSAARREIQASPERQPQNPERQPAAERQNQTPDHHQNVSAREVQLGMLAKAMGVNVTRNRDGSYDVKSPLDNPQQAASGILNKVFSGLVGGSNDGSVPVGMNSWHARAWQGFPEDKRQQQQDESRRRQEEQESKKRWEKSR